MAFKISNVSLETPLLIPSISSFETQLKPDVALSLQYALHERITLISAFDILNDSSLVETAKTFKDNNGIIFLDSGGYESSRIRRYNSDAADWNEEAFSRAANLISFDLAASYDYFIDIDEDITSFSDRILGEFLHQRCVPQETLVPVVHLVSLDGSRTLELKEAVDLVNRVAVETKASFIAIPERELGSGMLQKFSQVKEICDSLKSNTSTSLHILGCGNPLSFSILSYAGAAMADGLEWCRTYVSERFSLHHYQQMDLFQKNSNTGNPAGNILLQETNSYLMRVAVNNLINMQLFNQDLVEAHSDDAVPEFIENFFGREVRDMISGN